MSLTTAAEEHSEGGVLRPALLGALMAVYVARPLLVSESAATVAGDGLPLVMLTLVLAAVWWLAGVFRPELTRRFGWADFAWIALLAWQAVGTVLAIRTGWARAAINVWWEFVGLGMGFLLLRQLIASDRERRAMVVAMTAVALVISADGLFQFYVSLPAMREEYRLHPEAVLRAAGVVAPAGSPARMLFEQRLRSTEPMATFALANSLAGFLVPWLVMMLGIACCDRRGSRPAAIRHGAVSAAVILPLALCLVLTKSRSAYLASLLGLAGVAIASRRAARPMARVPRAAFFAAATVMVIALAIVLGGKSLDREIFSEAVKSFSYRWQYWHAAVKLIGDHPWFGCGLGNFQDLYTRYKLPQASEVVADPHNFLLEIWSTSGTPAMLALVAIFAGAALQFRSRAAAAIPHDHARRAVEIGPTNAAVYAILAGAAAGFVLAFLTGLVATVGLPIELLAMGLLCVVAAALVGWHWIDSGEMPRALPFIAVGALLVNLLAAGGIGFGGVAGSLWLLLAIALGSCRTALSASLPRAAAIGPLTVAVILAVVCHVSAYRPVLRCRMRLDEAEAEPRMAEQSLRAAAAADPLADQPWRSLAAIAFARFERGGDRRALAAWKEAQSELLRRRPFLSAAWRQAGDGYFSIYRQTREPRELTAAVEHYQRAVALYPNYALARANLALALSAAGRQKQAQEQAAEALRLHELTPHADQKLSPDVLAEIRPLAKPHADGP
ncbi:MAG TPA: O-antigen ligase family protein [Pirellulales bacterium]|nr:O-antigen ligase family protein [Pirellulales bacterium]